MAALAFCSLDFCSFGGMVSSSYARSTARADCLWTASLTPGPPFLLVAAGGQLGRLFRVRIPSWAGFFLATRVENECKLLFCTEIGPERLPKIQPPPKAPPASEGRGRVEIPCCERKKNFDPPPQEGRSQGRASQGRARGKQTQVQPARNLPEPKDVVNMGHKNVWNSHPRKYGLGSHPW